MGVQQLLLAIVSALSTPARAMLNLVCTYLWLRREGPALLLLPATAAGNDADLADP